MNWQALPREVDGIPCAQPQVHIRPMLELIHANCTCSDYHDCTWALGPDAYHGKAEQEHDHHALDRP